MKLFEWEAPGPYRVAFSTRLGGVSEGPYASLNLGAKTDDDYDRVSENRRRLCAETGADATSATARSMGIALRTGPTPPAPWRAPPAPAPARRRVAAGR